MKKYSFRAKIEAGDGGGAYILFPFDVEKEFGAKGKVPVQALFSAIPYTGSLMKYGNPLHLLGVPKAIRQQIGAGPGDTIDVELWKDDQPRTIEVPAPLQQAMKRAGVLKTFEALAASHRREYCRWITEAKKEETRLKRIDKAIDLLKKGVKTPDGPARFSL